MHPSYAVFHCPEGWINEITKRIIVLAACAAYGAIIGGASLAQATPMKGLLPAAPAGLPVEHVQFPCVFPFNCGYGYYKGGYYGRGYYGHRYR